MSIKLPVSAAMVFKAAGNRKSVTVRRRERRNCSMRLNLWDGLANQMRTAKRIELVGAGAFALAVLKKPAVCRYFGFRAQPKFARSLRKNKVAKGADNGYERRCAEFSPDIAGLLGIAVAQSWKE